MNRCQQLLWAGENSLKYHINLKSYFDVNLLSDVISSIGPKISDCDTYVSTVYRGMKCVHYSYIIGVKINRKGNHIQEKPKLG